MSDTPDHLTSGWFTSTQWRELRPCIERLVSKPGGVLLISVEIDPTRRNYPTVAFGVFDAAERQALRRALEAARKKREKTKTLPIGKEQPLL
jgi:hypothetical protein